jgi:glycosyltransferase involved in cell wall biosynthesis
MSLKLNYAIALFKALTSLKQMFERIAFNLNFGYHCEKLRQLNNKPLISFVVPTRNEARYLPRLLTSINYITQVCRVPAETIVVDYRSKDGTPNIAKKMGAKVIEVDKPGVGYASYVGVLSAKGDIVIRTDADAIMTPSAVYETIKFLQIAEGVHKQSFMRFDVEIDTLDNILNKLGIGRIDLMKENRYRGLCL